MKKNTTESDLTRIFMHTHTLFYLFRCIDDPCVVAKLQGANNSRAQREQEVARYLFLCKKELDSIKRNSE